MAKQLAWTVGYTYIDSGAMYRAVTLYVLRNGLFRGDVVDEGRLQTIIDRLDISFRKQQNTGDTVTCLNGENVEADIRWMKVAEWVSRVAAIGFVRRKLVACQQAMGQDREIVMDGRDIGTVVFPDAELKVFVTAKAEIRAQRRADELRANGQTVSFEEVLANVQQRDRTDMMREDSPLRKATDAIELDNTCLTVLEQQTWLLERFRQATIEPEG